jgi:hypothetical protein
MDTIIEIYGKKSEQLYNFIYDYNELLHINLLYLENKIEFSLLNKPNININKIIELNKLGFLVLEGQNALYEESKQQKSYIEGIIDIKYINNLIKFMNNKNVYLYISNNKLGWFNTKPNILFNNFPKLPYNISINIQNNKYNYKSLDTYYNEKLLLFKKFPKIINLLKETIYIRIASINYNIYSIEDLLIEFLKIDI